MLSADVPLITGTNLNESVSGVDNPGSEMMTVEEMNRRLHEAYGNDAEAIIAAYRQDYPNATPFGLYAAIATSRWRIPAIRAGWQEGRTGRCTGICLHLFVANPRARRSPRYIPRF